jgi:hypothetical protein
LANSTPAVQPQHKLFLVLLGVLCDSFASFAVKGFSLARPKALNRKVREGIAKYAKKNNRVGERRDRLLH